MKKCYRLLTTLFVIPFIFFTILLQGCSSTISLSRSPSDLVLVTIKPNNKDFIFYTTDSRVTEPFEYKNNGYSYVFPINKAFKNNIDSYMQTKFSKILSLSTKNDSTFIIKYDLKDFEIEYNLEQSTGDVLNSIFGKNGDQGDAIVDVKMTVSVSISRGGKIISEKNVVSTSRFSEYLQKDLKLENVYGKAVNDGISKCVIMIDKYLVSVDL